RRRPSTVRTLRVDLLHRRQRETASVNAIAGALALDCTRLERTLRSMNAAAKSSTVSLYVAIAGTLTAVVSLLGATLRLLAVLVTSLTGLIQRVVARTAKARALPPQPVAAVAPLRTLRPVPPPTTPAPIAQVSPGWRTQPMATVRPLSQPADDRTQPMARVPWAVTVAPPALVPPARVAPPAFVAHHSRCQSFPAIVMHEPGQAFQLPAIGHLES